VPAGVWALYVDRSTPWTTTSYRHHRQELVHTAYFHRITKCHSSSGIRHARGRDDCPSSENPLKYALLVHVFAVCGDRCAILFTTTILLCAFVSSQITNINFCHSPVKYIRLGTCTCNFCTWGGTCILVLELVHGLDVVESVVSESGSCAVAARSSFFFDSLLVQCNSAQT